MPQERLPMRKIREVLRLKAQGLSKRQLAASLESARQLQWSVCIEHAAAGLSWPLPDDLDDAVLELRLYPPATSNKVQRPQPHWPSIHRELKRPGVTLQLLWEEYRGQHPGGYANSQFCEHYRAWKGRLTPTMRQTHIAGERLFVDYAGTTLTVIDGLTGEVMTAQLFVAVLGASSIYIRRSHVDADGWPIGSARIRAPLPSLAASRRSL